MIYDITFQVNMREVGVGHLHIVPTVRVPSPADLPTYTHCEFAGANVDLREGGTQRQGLGDVIHGGQEHTVV